jgi:hypothetical protein
MKKRSKREKLLYKEGTWFAMPLRNGGYAVGRVARHSGDGCILGYFFAPRRDTVPSLVEVEHLEPLSAIKILMVGDLGFIEGSWQVIGNSATWEREKWPIPFFMRTDDIGKVSWRVIYSDDNLYTPAKEERIPYNSSGYEDAGLYGSGAAEIAVTQLLS